MGMRILVTGGSGWIGRHVCEQINQRGGTAVPFDSATSGDVRDPAAIQSAAEGCDAVIHLAGLLGTHELFATAAAAVEVNVAGTLNVLEACRRHGVGYVGITMPDVNPSLYSATKNCGKAIAEAYRLAHGLSVAHVIAYNAYGPGQAHGPGHPQKIVPTFSTRAWAGQPIPIWGDGNLWVDLVHVEDVARMLVDATQFGDGEIFDAGTGIPFTVKEAAQAVHAVAGDTGIEWLPPRQGERRQRTRDDYASGRGWELLGWRPRHDLSLLAEAILSYRSHPSTQAAA